MAAEFRCEKCGKLLNVEAEPSSKIRCPYCKARIQVPAGVASLPRPQVPPTVPAAAPPAAQGQAEEAVYEEQGQDALMGVMARLMPWIISLFFHAGVVVILAFVTIVIFRTKAPADIIIPDAEIGEHPGGRINPGQANPELQSRALQQVNKSWAQRDSTVPLDDAGETKNQITLYGISGGSAGGQAADFGLLAGGSGRGPRSRFMGLGGNAYHIVYVVDRSGSMLDTFDEVRREMQRSISMLQEVQTFHVIFFASGTPKENAAQRLVYATEAHKREALQYLKTIQPQGQTDPLPALKRAFQVLSSTPNAKRGKLIYLLTDAEFPDNELVLQTVRSLNADKSVHINTILHRHKSENAMKVLRQIAEENGGRFKFVESNE